MEFNTVIEIAKTINEKAGPDGVIASIEHPCTDHRSREYSRPDLWDIHLKYNDYHLIERFNSDMWVDESMVKKISISLLSSIFSEYFNEKIGA